MDARLLLDASAGRQAGQPIPLSNTFRERSEQVADAVGVIAHERTIPGKYGIPGAYPHENPPHVKHAPGAIENLFDATLSMDYSRIELRQHVAHVRHSRE